MNPEFLRFLQQTHGGIGALGCVGIPHILRGCVAIYGHHFPSFADCRSRIEDCLKAFDSEYILRAVKIVLYLNGPLLSTSLVPELAEGQVMA